MPEALRNPTARGLTRRQLVKYSAVALAGVAGASVLGKELLDDHAGTTPRSLGARLQAGSSWDLTGSRNGEIDYRGRRALETQTIRMVSQADGSEARVTLARTQPVSLRGNLLRFWLQVDPASAAHLRQVIVQLGSGATTFESYANQSLVQVNDLASYETEFLKPGEWVSITLCPASLASFSVGVLAFDAIRDFAISVHDDGANPAVVYFGGMQVIPAEQVFPHGVVSLTFDDGLASPYLNALPEMKRHGFRGTAYLIHDLVGSAGYLTSAQLDELGNAGWELAAHADSTRIHNAPRGLVDVAGRGMLNDWQRERAWLSARHARGFDDLAFPLGSFDRRVMGELQRYGEFQTARTTNFRSVETLPVADRYRLRTISYDVTVPIGPPDRLASVKWRIDQIAHYGGWLILTFHEVMKEHATGSAISVARFSEVLEYIERRNVPVRTVAEVWAASGRALGLAPLRPRVHAQR